jgi:hypothetical protein
MSESPLIKRDKRGRIVWNEALLTFIRERALSGVSARSVSKELGVSDSSIYDASDRYKFPFIKYTPTTQVKTPEVGCLDGVVTSSERAIAGAMSLPSGHPLTWGVIANGAAFPLKPKSYFARRY